MNFDKYLENHEYIIYRAKQSGNFIYVGVFLIILFGIFVTYCSGLQELCSAETLHSV